MDQDQNQDQVPKTDETLTGQDVDPAALESSAEDEIVDLAEQASDDDDETAEGGVAADEDEDESGSDSQDVGGDDHDEQV